jgi:hypothetical protein
MGGMPFKRHPSNKSWDANRILFSPKVIFDLKVFPVIGHNIIAPVFTIYNLG